MSTPSLTIVHSKWPGQKWKTHAVIYLHWDGYLDGQGRWLYRNLKDMVIVNGKGNNLPDKWVNGPGRLASWLVAEMWEDGVEPYLEAGLGDYGQNYEYHIYVRFGKNGGKMKIEALAVRGNGKTTSLFSGGVRAFGKFLNNRNDDDDDDE